jgi:hypothetical protein
MRPILVWANQSAFIGGDNGLSAVAWSQLGQHAADLSLDGFLGDRESDGDFHIGQAFGDQAQDLGFAWGE